MTTLQEKRHRETKDSIWRLLAQRDDCLAKLVKHEAKLDKLRKLLARQGKALAKAPAPEPRQAIAPPTPTQAPDDDPIPAFLDRRKASDQRDAERRAEIEQANAERKRTKSQVRIEKLKAKQAGLTRRMPLVGREALAAIRAPGTR